MVSGVWGGVYWGCVAAAAAAAEEAAATLEKAEA